MAGLRTAVGLLLLAITGAWLVHSEADSTGTGFDVLARLFGIATVLAGSTLYVSEQKQGTFELAWLARGSRLGLVQARSFTLVFALTLLMVPVTLLVSWYLYGTLPFLTAMVFLTTNSLFIVSVMALAGTLFPQAWAGGLVGGAAILLLYLQTGDRISVFNVFLNPLVAPEYTMAGGGAFEVEVDPMSIAVANRVFTLIASWVILVAASRRLHRAFRR